MLIYVGDYRPIDENQATYFQVENIQLSRFSISSWNPGPHFVATGSIHADEPSGRNALFKLYNELVDPENPLRLQKGRLTFFPTVNQAASFTPNHEGSLGARGIHRDGNRNVSRLGLLEAPQDHERLVGHALNREFKKILLRRIDEKFDKPQPTSWVFADFHDVPFDGDPHSVISGAPNDEAFAQAAGLPIIISNWREPQLALSEKQLEAIGRTLKQQEDFTRTAIYAAKEHLAKASVCFEGGFNKDGTSSDVNYEVLRNLLAYTGQLPALHDDEREHTLATGFTRVSVHQTIYKTHPEVRLSPHITRDDQALSPGEIFAENQHGGFITPEPLDDKGHWRVLHPIPDPKPGDHLVHLAYQREP